MSGECNLGSVTSQQKFEATDTKALRASQLLDSVIAPSVLFRKQRKIHPRGVGECSPKRHKEKREREKETKIICARRGVVVRGGGRDRE